jgi:hypothetical protein
VHRDRASMQRVTIDIADKKEMSVWRKRFGVWPNSYAERFYDGRLFKIEVFSFSAMC